MLRWDQLPALEAGGIELGAHTLTHPPLDILPEGMAFTEIKDSKVILEDALGHPVRSFAYPHGHHDRRVTTLVRHAGFDSACAVKNALSSGTDDAFALSRLTVLASTPDATLEQWLLGTGAPRCSPRRRLRTRAGRHYRRFVSRQWP
jgi:peptidoglycan/xylan/chitin deacetylase (PgdA/CDA1 family)